MEQQLNRDAIIKFCQSIVNLILLAGGQPSTAYKCALEYAESLEGKLEGNHVGS